MHGRRRSPLIATLALTALGALAPAEASTGVSAGAPCIAALTERCESWAAVYDGPAGLDDLAEDLAISPDGSTLFTGGSRIVGGSPLTGADSDFGVVANDADTGAFLWATGYGGPGSPDGARDDGVLDLAASADGSLVYATGYSRGETGDIDYDYATIALDAITGTRRWAERMAGDPGDWDQVSELATGTVTDAEDRSRELVFVSGYSYTADGGGHSITVAYEGATGDEVWRAQMEGGPEIRGLAFVPDPREDGSVGGRVIVTGRDFRAAAYDAETGDLLWEQEGPDVGDAGYAWDAAASPDGRHVYATGVAAILDLTLGSSIDGFTVAYDSATGDVAWTAVYRGTGEGDDVGQAVVADADRVYVTGYGKGEGPLTEGFVAAYDAGSGATAWQASQQGPGGGSFTGWAITTSPDGAHVFASGYAPFTVTDYRAGDGRRLWTARYTPPATSDGAYALAVSPDSSRLFAAGAHSAVPVSQQATGSDFLTAAYEI
ncbi:MAG TPA: PQQ-binding-like beta-propeller repeat protein [Actinomycetota bacterium]